jgi:hypothetical protein
VKSKVSNLQLLNNTEHRVKFKTGSDIDNAKDPIVGELFLETSKQDDISFDGQSKIDTDYTFGGGEISLSAWVKTTNPGSFIIATDSPSGGNDTSFAFGFKDSTTPYVLIGNPGQQVYKAGSFTAINDGNWHNIIVTIDNSNVMNFYIDGALEETHPFTIAPGASDHVTHYGSGWHDGIDPFYDAWGLDGQLNGLGIWERVLTDKEINTISSSGRYSPSPSHFSPDLWVGSTDPALYTCTDTSKTISKVTDLTAKMGDVPFLKLNESSLTSTFSTSGADALFPISGHASSHSFWFYDDGSDTTSSYIIFYHAASTYVLVNHRDSLLNFNSHGNMNLATSTINSSIVTPFNTGFSLKYERNKLNNITFVKINGTTTPEHATGSRYVYLNGELIASNIGSSFFTYPQGGFKGLNLNNSNASLLFGDILYWDQDIKDIAGEIYDPIGGHKGHPSDGRNLSIPPKHYWRLGFPLEDGKIKDIGTDGTNHFTPDTVSSNQYEYKNIFGVDRSLEV